jgi:2-dehydro-3-deoxygalactonokinase
MIGIDWGLTHFRAFRIARDGTIRDRRSAPRGVQAVPNGRFGDTLRDEIGPWLAAGESHVLLSGMIGSRQGWKEAPTLPCPAGAAELAGGLVDIGFDWAQVKLVPGLWAADDSGLTETMRGEETQVLGIAALLRGGSLACVPGSHSRWVRVDSGRIVSFATHATGELFATLRAQLGLGRALREGPADGPAFEAGLVRSGQPGGLLHHLSGVRALSLPQPLQQADAPAYLSGILVGHEVRAALPPGGVVHVIGPTEQTAPYARAIAVCGGYAERHDGEATARGLALIGGQAVWG